MELAVAGAGRGGVGLACEAAAVPPPGTTRSRGMIDPAGIKSAVLFGKSTRKGCVFGSIR
ncbi:hypothetical protein UA75_26765 [Actinoalloteichus sp. GBA129-24]|uniref:Uncharacterized protein n=1 Tax=Actinoalloteichus fjordicus TaxID=1612552 RepID=A0AAC9PUR7_9PSEU|nr:hypothetical protein UA74_26180 [Actinoalloteichus fjordicus]APU23324.1 hypothetical protein UA75_26765 [Actinoalloteichus sp. GBA129-24]